MPTRKITAHPPPLLAPSENSGYPVSEVQAGVDDSAENQSGANCFFQEKHHYNIFGAIYKCDYTSL